MSSCRIMLPGVRRFLVFSSSGFKPLTSVFSLILTVLSRLLHPYCTDEKTYRLMEKRFSTVRGTPREVCRVTWRREEGGGT